MPAMQLLYGKYQIPILSPNDIPFFQLELPELALVKIFVVLGVRILTDERTNINHLGSIVAERQLHGQIARVNGIGDV